MSAIVCGKRSLFEDLPASSPVLKRARFNSSPIRFSPPPPLLSSLDHLVDIFPDMDKQFLERALTECGDDLDSAIKSLHGLRLGTNDKNLSVLANNKSDVSVESNGLPHPQGELANNGQAETEVDPSAVRSVHLDGGEWVDLFVKEMISASNVDDARGRASRALEVLEKSIVERASAEAAQSFHQENMMLKTQLEALIQENTILKRAVSIQHERQKEYEDKTQELQHLKQLASQYQEQLRTLEVNNYALTMHLKQAQQGNSFPGRYNPDVF